MNNNDNEMIMMNEQCQMDTTYAWSSGNDAIWKHVDVETDLSADVSEQ